MSVPALLAVAVYGFALGLPYFLDDGPHFIILGQTNGLQHWGDFDPFPFYRPLTFSVWKLFAPVGYPVFMLHALNVFVFGVCGVLVAVIGRRILRSWGAGLLAGSLFVLFPFAYQAVAMVAAFFHLTLTLGALLCIWAGLHYTAGGGRGWLALSMAGAFIGVFSHESGLLIPFLLAGMVLAGPPTSRRRLAAVVAPVGAVAGLYFVLWLAFAPGAGTRTLTADFPAAAAALLQGMIYPVVGAIRPFISGDATPALILGVVVVSGTVLVMVAGPHRRGAWCGIGWYGLAILPAAVLLEAGYVLGQLRLSLLASVGMAWVWAAALSALSRRRSLRPVAVVIGLWCLGLSLTVIGARRADFTRLAEWNAHAVQQAIRTDVLTTGAVWLNAPQSLAPLDADRRFLLGSEGVLWTDPTLDYSQQFWMNSGQQIRDISAWAAPELLQLDGVRYTPHGPPLVDLAILRDARQIYSTRFDGDRWRSVQVKGAQAPTPRLVDFPQIDARLQGADANQTNDGVQITTAWRLASAAPAKLFVHLYCDDTFITQSDGYIWGDMYPFHQWVAGEDAVSTRIIPLNTAEYPAGCLRVWVGLYDENTGVRYYAEQAGDRLPDDALKIDVMS
jgi:hypothetical protein